MSQKTGKGQIRPSAPPDLSFLSKPPLLRSETEREFDQLLSALRGEIEPSGIIEDIYVAEIAIIIWEILRLRRCKVTILNTAFRKALIDLIHESSWEAVPTLPTDDHQTDAYGLLDFDFKLSSERERKRLESECERWRKVVDLANRWFSSKSAKQMVLSILRKSQRDESAIEARAIRASSTDLDWLEKMLAALEARRDKSLRRIAEYRESFADRVRASADRIIDAEPNPIPRLEDSTKKSAA
jgi:hypothetical protein